MWCKGDKTALSILIQPFSLTQNWWDHICTRTALSRSLFKWCRLNLLGIACTTLTETTLGHYPNPRSYGFNASSHHTSVDSSQMWWSLQRALSGNDNYMLMWDQQDLKLYRFERSCHRVTSSSCCPLHEKRSVQSVPNPDMIIVELLENIMMAEEVSDMTAEQWDCWDVKYQQRQACWALKHSENWEAKTKRAGHWSMNGRLRCASRYGYCASGHNNTSTPKQMFSVWSVWHSVNNCVAADPYSGGQYEHGAQAVVRTSHQTLIQMLCWLTFQIPNELWKTWVYRFVNTEYILTMFI